ncbi:hypothetical protein PFAG_04936 [Plasmodium falciparum Santa Lucia]|uniref:Uncharacterized protein n=2 Tax=Plasmodium falciparum TaxID=5833 RepID=W7F8W3_PLAF8|nr:hypothetical protein PFBG_04900 [Plasmodium falciparum 7G8]EUT80295.1 hypothetical protein PFAG_04936 [Plasmodium falciparum Santa Lucia]
MYYISYFVYNFQSFCFYHFFKNNFYYFPVYSYNITWNNKSLYGYIYILSFYYMVKFEYNFLIISRNNKEILIIMH